ncbi:MAG: hypothetical protein MJZ25_12825 [Fibrobacter sp.]|nr:hypothetical protein [Fibrobacter sp.]
MIDPTHNQQTPEYDEPETDIIEDIADDSDSEYAELDFDSPYSDKNMIEMESEGMYDD